MVRREILAHPHADHDYGSAGDSGVALFVQGRRDTFQSLDDSLDCDPIVYPDKSDLLARLWLGSASEAFVPGCGAFGDDRRFQPFRGCDRHGDDVVWSFVGSGSRHGGRGLDRGAGDADAGQDLFAHQALVQVERAFLVVGCFGRVVRVDIL